MTICYRCDSCGNMVNHDNYRVSEYVTTGDQSGGYKNWHLCDLCFTRLKLPPEVAVE